MIDAIASDLPRFAVNRPFEDRLDHLRRIERVAFAAIMNALEELTVTRVDSSPCQYWRRMVRERRDRWERSLCELERAMGREE